MRSIRDLVHKLPDSKKSLEDYVLEYSPDVKEAIDRDPKNRAVLERIADETFENYHEYMGGLAQKIGSAGRAVGYTADAWLATGDIVGSLGGKFLHLLSQIPEKAYSLVYASKTGNYTDSLKNIFEGVVSYLPGFTVADEGLARIVQKRMVKEATNRVSHELGLENSEWYHRSAEAAKAAGYSDVKVRSDRIIRPNFGVEEKKPYRKAA